MLRALISVCLLVFSLNFCCGVAYADIAGDFNADGAIDCFDLAVLAGNWLSPDCNGCEADINGEGGVNGVDFAFLAANWGTRPPSLLITEFLASNASAEPLGEGELLDEDGDSSDWIEIFNTSDQLVDLTGWYLTNNADSLRQWQFPAGVFLDAGDFLIVFASGKNRSVAGQQLHTNFSLDAGGEYLALVEPDGRVAHEFDPQYPRQLTDISYGLAQYATTFVSPADSARYRIPTAGDDEADWTALNFDDSKWAWGSGGIGFGNISQGFEVVCYRANTVVDSIAAAEAVISTPALQSSIATETAQVIDYFNTGGTGNYLGDNPFPGLPDGEDSEDFVVLVTGMVLVPVRGDVTFGVNSDDGFALELSNGTNTYSMSYPDPRGPSDTLATFTFPNFDFYRLRLVYYERGGGSELEFFAAIGRYEFFDPAQFRLVGDAANGGLYVVSSSSDVKTDIQDSMKGVNASVWTRTAFDTEEPDFFTSMVLRMRYEDAFVAYLNGIEVARSNFTGEPQWNSVAQSNRPDELASQYVNYDLSARISDVRDGRNVLAIQGLNDNKNDDSFMIMPELAAASSQMKMQYFATPTPGKYNSTGTVNIVSDTQFSHDRGFYDAPFNLTIATETPGATINYTLDGSTPSETHGFKYAGLVHINTTTCLRAIAFKPGWVSSNVDTHTYIFPNDVAKQPANPSGFPTSWGGTGADYGVDPDVVNNPQYGSRLREALLSLPTMSIVTDMAHLFGPSGVYANPSGTGAGWERPTSVEWINPDGTTGFHVNAGMRMYGGAFRDNWGLTRKKSFRLLFKRQYGPTKLNFRMFDAEDAATSFDTIILRAGANDGWNSWGGANTQYIVDEFMRRTQLALGQPASHGTFVHLYLNGLYWGLYNPAERPQPSFCANYFGGDKADWDAVNSGNPAAGSSGATWNAMFSQVRGGLADMDAYQRIQGNNPDGANNPAYDDLLDVDNYIDYMFSNFWGGTGDWPWHNFYAGCRRPPEADGFKFFNWDSEGAILIWSDLNANVTGVNNGAGEPYAALRQNSEFCTLFGDHSYRHLFNDGPAGPAASYARYKELADEVELAIIAESARWGDMAGGSPYTLAHWQNTRNYILNTYMPQRPAIVLAQLRDAGLYPNLDAPEYYVNGMPQHGGQTATGDVLAMTNPNAGGKIYYSIDGNDVRVPVAIQIDGQTLVEEKSPKRAFVPSGDIGTAWRTNVNFNDSAWKAGGTTRGGVGYENGSGYEPYFDIDVRAEMSGINTSCYIRIPFNVSSEDLASFNFMVLQIRYDDGFVAYLNGTEVDRRNASGEPAWNSNSNGSHDDSAAVQFENLDISPFIDRLQAGNNLLAIHGLNVSTGSSDFLISAKLIAGESTASGELLSGSAIEYTGPLTLTESMRIKSRVLVGTNWSAINEATFAVSPVADNLRITEIMYHPFDANDPNDPNEEYIELKNLGPEAIKLGMVRFTDGVDFAFGDMELAAGQYVLVVEDIAAFEARYGSGLNVAGQYTGKLANGGEKIRVVDAAGQIVADFRYRDGWRSIADGGGYSLTIIDPANPDPNSWSLKDSWRASVYPGGSPGLDDSGILPDPGAIVINEVLAHSHDERSDWVELYNTTADLINIGGWYLSDSRSNLAKYRIAPGTTIGPYQYRVFHETTHFGANSVDPGVIEAFALSENGEIICLTSAIAGALTGYRESEKFGASETGVSFGRYYKQSTGNYNFVPMSYNTAWAANAYPKVGPVVISEIMYNPSWPNLGSYVNDEYEYIELHNMTAVDVPLYRYDKSSPWRFTEGIEYTFPASPNEVNIPAGGYVVVAKNPEAFMWRYPTVPAGKVLGPYTGSLSNNGEQVEISLPGDVDKYLVRQYIRVDRVAYSDGSHPEDNPGNVDLWPVAADGYGMSLDRIDADRYGNDPNNWQAATPSPGE